MAAFTPHTAQSALPGPGALETDSLDFKGRLNRTADGKVDHAELAKDIAAFANAHGGTILVGAWEDQRRGVLGRIDGLTDEEAKEARDAYSRAAAKFCSPSPVNDSHVVRHPTGNVVAVNVWPFPGQAVGVRCSGDAWSFPWRSGIETKALLPEHLPMLMIPDLRRRVALLRAIAPDDAVQVVFTKPGAQGFTGHVVDVRELENAVLLGRQPRAPETSCQRFSLDAVIEVFKRRDDWEVVIRSLY